MRKGRRNHISRALGQPGKVIIVIDTVQHTVSEAAFVELMGDALRVLKSLELDDYERQGLEAVRTSMPR